MLSRTLSFADARHLTVRAAFGADLNLISKFEGSNKTNAIKWLLSGSPDVPIPSGITEYTTFLRTRKRMDKGQKQLFRKKMRKEGYGLKIWWCAQLLTTDAPLVERMTLFWHNHFTSSFKKVKSPDLLLRQNKLLRRHAIGKFSDLLYDIARDPAMLIYLDSNNNRKGQPNENSARELLELFTLGTGHYTEKDIKSAALAFTGWGIDRKAGDFRIKHKQHATQPVRFLGWRIESDGKAVINRLLRHPRTAEFIAEKMWHEFISNEPPDPKTLRDLTLRFRRSGYSIKALLEGIFHCDCFWDPGVRGTIVKSPIDLLVGAFHELDISTDDGPPWIARRCRRLGQDLFDPPNVKGWPGGVSWITAETLALREQYISQLVRGLETQGGGMMQSSEATRNVKPLWLSELKSESLEQWLLPTTETTHRLRQDKWEMLKTITSDPLYQLK